MKDFYSDNGVLLAKLFSSERELPLILKQANYIANKDDILKFSDNSFADPVNKKFLINDPASTYVSAVYIKTASESIPLHIQENLKGAITLFGIENEIMRLEKLIISRKRAEEQKRAGNIKKVASACPDQNESWSVSLPEKDGGSKWSGKTKDSFLKACDQITGSNFSVTYPSGFLHKTAKAFVSEAMKKGDHFYRHLPDEVLKLAGYGYPDYNILDAYIGYRSVVLPNDVRRLFVNKYAELKKAEPTIEGFQKLAEFIERFDNSYGLQKFYGKQFPDPYRSVHNVSTREAVKYTSKLNIGDVTYHRNTINEDKAKKVARYVLGDVEFANIFSKGFDVEKLPKVISGNFAPTFNRLMQE